MVPDCLAIVQGAVRRTWRDFEQRSVRLAGALASHGAGSGAKVGQLLFDSPEFLESNFATLKLRALPFNVNYRYTAFELEYLLTTPMPTCSSGPTRLDGRPSSPITMTPGAGRKVPVSTLARRSGDRHAHPAFGGGDHVDDRHLRQVSQQTGLEIWRAPSTEQPERLQLALHVRLGQKQFLIMGH